MNKIKTSLKSLVVLLLLIIVGYLFYNFYPYIFAKEITGEVTAVDRLLSPQIAVINGSSNSDVSSQVFSFSVGIKDPKTNEIHVATSEDRQWAVVHPGQCATVKIYPYPPWQIYKAGTYFGARLIKLFECTK